MIRFVIFFVLGLGIVALLSVLLLVKTAPQGLLPGVNKDGAAFIGELAATGNGYTCTIESTTGVFNSVTTIFLAGKKIRGDSTIGVLGIFNFFKSHSIFKDKTALAWTSVAPWGLRIVFDFFGTRDATTRTEENTSYHCSLWPENPAVFETPGGITFLDIRIP